MDLRLEDYARKENREWYEILRNHVKEKPEKNVIRIYLRPSSGVISILRVAGGVPLPSILLNFIL